MPTAYYMQFIPGHHGALDRIGGVPTHLPREYPVSNFSGERLGFVAQFACHPERLPVDGFLVQIYLPVDADEPEFLRAIVLDHDCEPNEECLGPILPDTVRHDIAWIVVEDPVEPNRDPLVWDSSLWKSKARGTFVPCDIEPEGEFLLQLDEQPGGFNFASRNCVVMKLANNQIVAEFA